MFLVSLGTVSFCQMQKHVGINDTIILFPSDDRNRILFNYLTNKSVNINRPRNPHFSAHVLFLELFEVKGFSRFANCVFVYNFSDSDVVSFKKTR